MITFVDKKNIEELSEKLSRNFIELVNGSMKQAMNSGAVRIHETSTHFLSDNPKRVCATIANNLTNRGNKFINVSALCKDLVYKLNMSITNILTIWYAPANIIDHIKQESMVMKPKYYLIIIYRELYNPALIESFVENRKLIKSIFKGNLHKISSVKTAGGTYDKIYDILKTEVFVGKKAFNYLLDENMSDMPFEVISDNVSKTLKNLKKHFKNLKSETQEISVLTDFKLTRTFVKADNVEIIIYNSGDNELIPFIQGDVRIGCVYVVARFILINIFVMKFYGKEIKEKMYYMAEMHDKLIAGDFGDQYYIPDINNYYGFSRKEKTLFADCAREMDYKPMIVKKKLGKLLYF